MGWDLGGDAGAHEAGSWALKRSEVGLREGRWLVLKRHTLCPRMSRGEGVGVRGFGDGLARWMRPGGWWECCVFFYTEGWGGVSLSLLPGESWTLSCPMSTLTRPPRPWRWSGPSWAYSLWRLSHPPASAQGSVGGSTVQGLRQGASGAVVRWGGQTVQGPRRGGCAGKTGVRGLVKDAALLPVGLEGQGVAEPLRDPGSSPQESELGDRWWAVGGGAGVSRKMGGCRAARK